MAKKEIIPIVFVTEDYFAPYLGVALQSLISHTSQGYTYEIYVLYTQLSAEHRKRICSMAKENIKITCVDMMVHTSDLMGYDHSNYFPMEVIYRLLIPDLLKNYDKILYLDCDIVILEDIALLYQYPLEDCLLAVAELPMEQVKRNHAKFLGIEEKDLFNAGILLIHGAAFRQAQVKEQCIAVLKEDWVREEKKYPLQDQDVLAVVCQNRIKKFPLAWNFEWRYTFSQRGEEKLDPVSQEAFDKAAEDLKIIHYLSPFKPWDYPEYAYADLFWKYARETIFYEEILLQVTVKRKPKFLSFPWKEIPAGSVIVIYGGGIVGESYLEQIAMTSYCHVCGICDQNPLIKEKFFLPVVTKEALSSLTYDFIVIAANDKNAKESIQKDLEALGIAQEKIK